MMPPGSGIPASPAAELWAKLTVERDDDDTVEPVKLEHFLVERLIGRGGMGAVFLARDTRLNRPVALKVLSPEHTTSKSSLDRFRNEARAAARLDHENIARVHYLGGAFGVDTDSSMLGSSVLPFIAFEFIEGVNVREAIRQRGPFTPADTVRFALQLTSALRETDGCGVVHRDIKPSNVIITPRGRAKLVDLGLARTADPEASQDLTVAGTTLGTFDYISPEQAKDPRSVDIRSDIYSLGCTLFHMLIGRPPYPEGTMLQKLLDHQGGTAPDAHEIDRRVPQPLATLVQRMMNADPGGRPQSPTELLVELSEIGNQLGIRGGSGESLIVRSANADEGGFWQEHLGWGIAAALLAITALFADQFVAPPASLPSTASDQASTAELVSGEQTAPVEEPTIPLDSPIEPRSAPPATKRISPPPEKAGDTNPVVTPLTPSSGIVGTELAPIEPTGPGPVLSESVTGETTGSTSVSPTMRPIAPDLATNPFVVLQQGRELAFDDLGEAIEQARDGARIEIHRAGVAEISRQLRLSEKSIDITHASSLTERPVIRLREPILISRNGLKFFDVTNGGRLGLFDVDIEVEVSSRPNMRPWTVFSLNDGCTVELKRSAVTVISQPDSSASVFQVTASADESSLTVSLTLDQCLVRGDAVVIRADGQTSVDAPISDSAIAVTGSFLDVVPSSMPRQGVNERELSLHLDRTTVATNSSLLRVQADPEDRIARTRITADRSVFVALDPNLPMISMTGNLFAEDFRSLLDWDGEGNRFTAPVAWQISAVDGTIAPIESTQWQSLWGAYSVDESWVTEAIVSQPLDASGDRLAELKPEDFAATPEVVAASTRDGKPIPLGVPWTTPGFPTPRDRSAE